MVNHVTCRCCLRENPPNTYNLFENAGRLSAELLECAPNLQLAVNDGLPEIICDFCWQRVREMLDFRRRCEESERELRQRYVAAQGLQELLDCASAAVADADAMQQQQSVLNIDAELPLCASGAECAPLDLSLLDDLLPQEYNFDGILDYNGSIRMPNEEDPIISELLNKVNDDPNFVLSEQEQSDEETIVSSENRLTNKVETLHTQQQSTASTATCTFTTTPTPKSLYPCPQCEKKFTRNFQLKLHMISIHKLGNGRQYKCAECQKTFASRHSLSYHQKSIHTEERPFACPQCDRRFVLRTQLASHARIHTGQPKPRILECMECGKRWPTKSDLRTHMRSHVPAVERPFQCDQCEKSFFTRGHLSSHLLVHTGEKPYACALCDKAYQSVGNLNNHMVRHHAGVAVCGRGRGANAEQLDREI